MIDDKKDLCQNNIAFLNAHPNISSEEKESWYDVSVLCNSLFVRKDNTDIDSIIHEINGTLKALSYIPPCFPENDMLAHISYIIETEKNENILDFLNLLLLWHNGNLNEMFLISIAQSLTLILLHENSNLKTRALLAMSSILLDMPEITCVIPSLINFIILYYKEVKASAHKRKIIYYAKCLRGILNNINQCTKEHLIKIIKIISKLFSKRSEFPTLSLECLLMAHLFLNNEENATILLNSGLIQIIISMYENGESKEIWNRSNYLLGHCLLFPDLFFPLLSSFDINWIAPLIGCPSSDHILSSFYLMSNLMEIKIKETRELILSGYIRNVLDIYESLPYKAQFEITHYFLCLLNFMDLEIISLICSFGCIDLIFECIQSCSDIEEIRLAHSVFCKVIKEYIQNSLVDENLFTKVLEFIQTNTLSNDEIDAIANEIESLLGQQCL